MRLKGYRIVSLLSENSRTVVYRATRESDELSVIIKTHAGPQATQSERLRYRLAAECLSSLDSPSIPTFLELVGEEFRSALVMEDVGGIPLLDFLRSKSSWGTFGGIESTISEFVSLAIDITKALAEIHRQKIIHKDITPENIVINPSTGQLQIIDFGMCSRLSREQQMLTAPAFIQGALGYISPEQTGRMNRIIDHRTDFYSLGVTFFQMLTLELPFNAPEPVSLLQAHLSELSPTVCERNPAIPRVLSEIISRLMAKEAEDRYQNCEGLLHDLQRCEQALKQFGFITDFNLGEGDYCEHICLSQKLYGRERELNILNKRFDRSALGYPQFVMVSGGAGVGKSSLVKDFLRHVPQRHGVVVSGESHPLKRAMPYMALASALDDWLDHVLCYSEKEIDALRSAILDGVGCNAQVLIGIMPKLKLILGEQPELPELIGVESEHRFDYFIKKFLEVVAKQTPLVIFFDNLHWTDNSTLGLLTKLLSMKDIKLFVLAAYRDKDALENEDFLEFLERVKTSEEAVEQLHLRAPHKDFISSVLRDSHLCAETEIAAVSQILASKTDSNPFLLNQLIMSLMQQGLLYFDGQHKKWRWNLDGLSSLQTSDNVVDLLLYRLNTLPPQCRSLLSLGACIGNSFDVRTLASIAGMNYEQTSTQLWPAVVAGVVRQETSAPLSAESGFTVEGNDASMVDTLLRSASILMLQSPVCHFDHDRIFLAAYSLLSEDEKERTHLRLGRMLQSQLSSECVNERYLSMVEQFNRGRSQLTRDDEVVAVAHMNYRAGMWAKSNSAFNQALKLFHVGVELYNSIENPWRNHYEGVSRLYDAFGECEYICGATADSETTYKELIERSDDNAAQAEVYYHRLVQYLGNFELNKALDMAFRGLNACGLKIVDDLEWISNELANEQVLLDKILTEQFMRSLASAGLNQDESNGLKNKLLSLLALTSFLAGRDELNLLAALKGVNVALSSGESDSVGFMFSVINAHYLKNRDYERAELFYHAAVNNADRYPNVKDASATFAALGMRGIYHGHISKCITYLDQGIRSALTHGELFWVSVNAINIVYQKYAAGVALSEVETDLNRVEELDSHKRIVSLPVNYYGKLLAVIGNEHELSLASDFSNEALGKEEIKSSHYFGVLCYLRSQIALWCDNESEYDAIERDCAVGVSKLFGSIHYVEHEFTLGLLGARVNKVGATDPAFDRWLSSKISYLEEIASCVQENFEHKVLLLKGEQARLAASEMDAVAYFEKAILSARDNGFIQYEALGNELMARVFSARGIDSLAENYLCEAIALYQRWGCLRRAHLLRSEFSYLLEAPSNQIKMATGNKENLGESVLLEASQMVTKETSLRPLLAKFLELASDFSGADYGAILLLNGRHLTVEVTSADAIASQHLRVVSDSAIAEEGSLYPAPIVKYVIRTRGDLVLGNAIDQSIYDSDPYVKERQVKSVLCLPLMLSSQLLGVVYLEHSKLANAFTLEIAEFLKPLINQTVICAANARKMQGQEQLVESLEGILEERTAELKGVHQELEAFSFTVCHDLKAPTRRIMALCDMLMEDIDDPRLSQQAAESLTLLKKSSSEMTELLSGLLQWSESTKGEFRREHFDISSLVRVKAKLLQTQDDSRAIDWHIEPGLEAYGDRQLVDRLIDNLLTNAWKYTSKRERAVIEFGVVKGNGTSLNSACFYLRDNGVGYNQDHAEKLFQPFQKLHGADEYGGIGVGLAAVQRIIKRHGGQIWAESNLGDGATFYFTLGLY